MNWTRVILGGLLAEVLVLVLLAPIALAVGLDALSDPANIPASIGYGVVVASFVAPLVLVQWVARRVTSRFVLHGALVGFAAFVVYMIPMTLSGESQPPIYWVAHAMKLLGGVAGGLWAARRHPAKIAVV